MPTYNAHIGTILKTLPDKSGVYRYFDKNGVILYVGKAKNLKKRVYSYFHKEQIDPRIQLLVRKIVSVEYTVVDTEYDALLLEINLIKEYRPKYNIMLKDDKTYPWLCITDEAFPRLFSVRQKQEEHARYFGPYASVKIMNALLDTISELYPLRKCRLNLTENNIHSDKFKPCLNYHIKKCHGICVGNLDEESYKEYIVHIVNVIQGNVSLVIQELKSKMMIYAKDMAFERAHEIKMKIELLEKYQAKSTIVSSSINNVDVFGIVEDASSAYVCYFHVVNGSIVQTQTVSIKQQLNESLEDILLYAVVDFRNKFQSTTREIIVPCPLDYDIDQVTVTVPKSKEEDEYKLLQLAYRNAVGYMHEKHRQRELTDPDRHKKELLETMQKDLQLPRPPAYIECFDNSNIQGKFPVSSMVCFRDGKPSKREYRLFNVKSLDTPDDFSTMAETITRRYTRLQKAGETLPDLIVVDGGKGQVSATYAVLQQMGLEDKIPLIGIAKRLEELYKPNDPVPLFVDKKSETQRVIQHMRDEAHRFGITHHRKRRNKALMQTELTNIQGIGDQLAAKLLSVFRSVSVIKNTSLEDLQKVVGVSKAVTLYNYYHTDLSSSKK